VADEVSLKVRSFAEHLLRVWVEARDEAEVQGDPSFASFNATTRFILDGLGMVWDVGHGYVFPWTNRVEGPFPMTGFEEVKKREWVNGYCHGAAVLADGNFSDVVRCQALTVSSVKAAGVDGHILDVLVREGLK
jgi:hypothetical protein